MGKTANKIAEPPKPRTSCCIHRSSGQICSGHQTRLYVGLMAAGLYIGGSNLSFTCPLCSEGPLELSLWLSPAARVHFFLPVTWSTFSTMRPSGKGPGRSFSLCLHLQMSMSAAKRMGTAAKSATTNQEASNVPAIAASRLPQMVGPAKVRPWLCN